jgi:hypothetical protein
MAAFTDAELTFLRSVMEPQPLIRIHPERVSSWGLTETPE